MGRRVARWVGLRASSRFNSFGGGEGNGRGVVVGEEPVQS